MLHGAKVGVGTVLAARRYEVIRGLTQQEAIGRLSTASKPSQEDEIEHIRTVYGTVAERIIANHRPFLAMMEASFEALRRKIGERWAKVQEIAAGVPPSEEIADLLEQAGGPSSPQAIGLSEGEVRQALEFSRYIRARFTVDTLGRVLGLW